MQYGKWPQVWWKYFWSQKAIEKGMFLPNKWLPSALRSRSMQGCGASHLPPVARIRLQWLEGAPQVLKAKFMICSIWKGWCTARFSGAACCLRPLERLQESLVNHNWILFFGLQNLRALLKIDQVFPRPPFTAYSI